MKEKSIYGFHKTESSPLWKWKGINFPSENKLYPVAEYFQKTKRELDDFVLGPGVGAGIGCGVGLGLGVVGGVGVGVGGMDWNNLTAVFGIGIGCGIGVGFGYGQGFGGGFSLESLKSHVLKPKK